MSKFKNILNKSEDPFNLTINDLMAGLMSIFIFALCFVVLNFTQANSDNAAKRTNMVNSDNNVKRTNVVNSLGSIIERSISKGTTASKVSTIWSPSTGKIMSGGNVLLEIDAIRGVMHIPDSMIHFKMGAHTTDEMGVYHAGLIADALLEILNKEEKIDTVFIEGHTDNQKFYGDEDGMENWRLSSNRAVEIYRIMCEKRPELAELRNKNGQPIFSVSGYGPTRNIKDDPQDMQLSEDDRNKRNRRIDIRFTMLAPAENSK